MIFDHPDEGGREVNMSAARVRWSVYLFDHLCVKMISCKLKTFYNYRRECGHDAIKSPMLLKNEISKRNNTIHVRISRSNEK